MELEALASALSDYVMGSPDNAIQSEYALREELVGIPLFAAPLVGCARADDLMFERIKSDDAILGDMFRLPTDWLPGAKSVISIFYPFSDPVRKSNRPDLFTASAEWQHGRTEGNEFINATDRMVESWLQAEGYETRIPSLDPEFARIKREPEEAVGKRMFASNWSERHVAFTCGLGTFGLSANLITRVGDAGRLGSIVTTAELEPTPRPYGNDPFAYCTMCGACTNRCPVDCLSLEDGKDYQKCWAYIQESKIRFKPRLGCGKCQISVPCEKGIPNKKYA